MQTGAHTRTHTHTHTVFRAVLFNRGLDLSKEDVRPCILVPGTSERQGKLRIILRESEREIAEDFEIASVVILCSMNQMSMISIVHMISSCLFRYSYYRSMQKQQNPAGLGICFAWASSISWCTGTCGSARRTSWSAPVSTRCILSGSPSLIRMDMPGDNWTFWSPSLDLSWGNRKT